MHRPKQFVGERYGVKYPSIWLKFSDDLLAWEDKPSHLLIAGREGTWEEKIGGKHAADPDRGGVADALPRSRRRRHGPNTASGRCCSTGRIRCGCWPDAGTDPRTRIFYETEGFTAIASSRPAMWSSTACCTSITAERTNM